MPRAPRRRRPGPTLALLNMEGLNLEYKKVVVEALCGSHTAARHTHFLVEECHLPVSAIRQIYGVVLLFAYGNIVYNHEFNIISILIIMKHHIVQGQIRLAHVRRL